MREQLSKISTKDMLIPMELQFQLYYRNHVDVHRRDVGRIPAQNRPDYDFFPKVPKCKPPIPLSALKHFIEYPSHAATRKSHLQRIPKKIYGRLALPAHKDEIEGWGLQFHESLCWAKLSVVEFSIES